MAKKAKVVSVKGDGTWKEFYKFEVELDNGDSGVMYKKNGEMKYAHVKEYSLKIYDYKTADEYAEWDY